MTDNSSFLGNGWGFPPTFDKSSKQVKMVTNEHDIQESLEILLNTIKGERVMQPVFGCNIQQMVFDSFTTTTQTYLRNLITQSVLHYESRITLIDINFEISSLREGVVSINLEYIIRTTNTRSNYVFPFYLVEGTHITK